MKNLPSKITPGAIEHILAQSKVDYAVLGGKLTHCMITLPSGFIVTGESSCVDPAEYNKALGEKYAKDRAVQMLYMFEGYTLASALYEQRERANPFVNLVYEHSEVLENIDSLKAYAKQCKDDVSGEAYALMGDQHMAMEEYASLLSARMDLYKKEKKDV